MINVSAKSQNVDIEQNVCFPAISTQISALKRDTTFWRVHYHTRHFVKASVNNIFYNRPNRFWFFCPQPYCYGSLSPLLWCHFQLHPTQLPEKNDWHCTFLETWKTLHNNILKYVKYQHFNTTSASYVCRKAHYYMWICCVIILKSQQKYC